MRENTHIGLSNNVTECNYHTPVTGISTGPARQEGSEYINTDMNIIKQIAMAV